MPESANVEIAHNLHEHGKGTHSRPWVEIAEAVLLALVAIATAWSGYQSALWDGHEAKLYGEASKLRFEANAHESRAGQEQVYDAGTLNSWLQARLTGQERTAATFEKRFRLEYRPAFRAWLKSMVHNAVCDHFRYLERHPDHQGHGGSDLVELLAGVEAPEAPEALAQEMDQRFEQDVSQALQAARELVTEQMWEAFWRRIYLGRPAAEVA